MKDQPDSEPPPEPPPPQEEPPAAQEEEDPPTSRRGFFREALAGLIGPVVELIQDRFHLELPACPYDYEYTPPPLRPPGAVAGDAFAELCTGCGQCASACGPGAIVMDGGPRIDPDRAGCQMCPGLPCVAACPTGALEEVSTEQVCLGLAVWDPSQCKVMAGETCDACRQACPVAGCIAVEEYYVEVDGQKCTGCGLCQQACPMDPKAIVVEPY